MSLKMYLGSVPKIDGYTFQELMDYEEKLYKDLDVLPDDVQPFAYKKGITTWYSLTADIGTWTNTFSIHDWFIQRFVNNENDGLPYAVSKDELLELVRQVKEVLFDNVNTGTNKAAEANFLPNDEFSIIGGNFNEEFYKELRRTLYILEEALKVDFDNNYVYYQAD